MPASASVRPVTPFPERIGRYELLLPIGTGGMATVFLARTSGVGGFTRDVAVKIIHAHLRADEESKNHLLDEARLAARIRHPNVVPVIEVEDDPFGVYLVMDYVEGDSLAGVMRVAKGAKERLPLRVVGRILSDTLSGLHAAHELRDESGKSLGLVHRDYTPQNILVGVDGVSRLSDFSVAKAGDRAVRTRTGLVKGKIAYMSPEQARGHTVDRRCDVWAAGVVAWELIAWRRLHKKVDAVATLLSVVTEPPPRLRDVYPEVPPALDDVVARALTMEVEDRIPSALELRRQLDEAFRTAGGIADTQEVGELVTRLFGPKLEERRVRITEVRQLRVRMEEIARPSAPDSELSPDELAAARLALAEEDSGERTRPERAIGPRQVDVVPTEPEVPRVVSVATAHAQAPDPGRRRRLAFGVAAAVALAGAVGIAALRSNTSKPGDAVVAEPARVEPGAPVQAPQQPASNVEDPSAVKNAATDVPAAADPSAPKHAEARTASRGAARGSTKRTPAESASSKIAAPSSKAPPKLARDPYGDNK
jgi:eukaryotic-like serine/threonine-protein kinase